MVRWSLLFAFPILICALFFQWLVVTFEDWQINFFGGGHPYGAPFPVGVGWMATPVNQNTPNPERFSSLWFAVDVMLTAAIAAVIAWFLRVRNAWPASVAATAVATLLLFAAGSNPPIPIRSYGFSYWIYWLAAFAIVAAGFELYRTRPRRT